MKTGDTVQVVHLDGAVHWIYATVITPNEDGSALVQINPPGNIEHGATKFLPKEKIRTKADVQTELDEMEKPNSPEFMEAWRKNRAGLEAQIDRLS